MWSFAAPCCLSHPAYKEDKRNDLPQHLTPMAIFIIPLWLRERSFCRYRGLYIIIISLLNFVPCHTDWQCKDSVNNLFSQEKNVSINQWLGAGSGRVLRVCLKVPFDDTRFLSHWAWVLKGRDGLRSKSSYTSGKIKAGKDGFYSIEPRWNKIAYNPWTLEFPFLQNHESAENLWTKQAFLVNYRKNYISPRLPLTSVIADRPYFEKISDDELMIMMPHRWEEMPPKTILTTPVQLPTKNVSSINCKVDYNLKSCSRLCINCFYKAYFY